MKLLHINEARCAGRSVDANPKICPERDRCLRNRQIELGRQLGIGSIRNIQVYSLPRVGRNECHFRIIADE